MSTMNESKAILTGGTYMVRQRLAAKGWRWDAERKAYVKVAQWDSPADVIRTVRMYPGVRNRGNFAAILEPMDV